MLKLLSEKQKVEIKKILPDFSEKLFITKAIDSAIRKIKAGVFFDISEEIKSGLEKKGYSAKKILSDFKD